MYKITLFPEFSLTGRKEVKEFNNKNEALGYLVDGMSYEEVEVEKLLNEGGSYKGLDGIEFEVEILEAKKEKNLDPQWWADLLKDFYEDSDIDYSKHDIDNFAEDILNSPPGEEMGLNENEARQIAAEMYGLMQDEEKNAFNDPKLFLKEYKNYLIGKKVAFKGYESQKIEDVVLAKDHNIVSSVHGNIVLNNSIVLDFADSYQIVDKDDLRNLIDGNEIAGSEDDNGAIMFHLILQEEKQKTSPNKPEYKYYVINDNAMILSGHEYKEDAVEDAEKRKVYGIDATVISKKEFKEVDTNNADNWLINEHDWSIIEKCLTNCSNEGSCSPKEAAKYVSEFKESGKHVSIIKAVLIQCLEKAQTKLRGAYSISNLEAIGEKCDENCRIQKELKRIIAMEK